MVYNVPMSNKEIVFWPSGLPSDQDRSEFRRSCTYVVERMGQRFKIFQQIADVANDADDVPQYVAALGAVRKHLEELDKVIADHLDALAADQKRRQERDGHSPRD